MSFTVELAGRIVALARGALWGGVVLLLAAPAQAQATDPQQAPLPLERFTPSFAGDRFFNTQAPYAAGHLDVHTRLMGEYSHNPFVLRRTVAGETEEVGSVVEHQLLLHLNATVAAFRRLAFNLDFPIALAQSGDDPSDGRTTFLSPSDPAVGDLRIGLRANLTGAPDDFFQLGMGAFVWVPTARDAPGSYLGNGSVRVKPHLMASGIALRFVWGLEAGIEFRDTQDVLGVKQGSLMTIRLANGVLLGAEDQVQLSVELGGALVPVDISKKTGNFEALFAGSWRFADDFVVGAGAGPGLFSGIGTPDARAVLTFAYTPLQNMGVMHSVRPPE